ncbi:MAG: DUF4118 domain-containing protein [Mycobacterium sp.]
MTSTAPLDAETERRSTRARLLALLLHPTAPPLWLGVVVAAVLIAAETALVHVLRHIAPENTFGAVFLLGVLVISAGWGFGLALLTTLASAAVYVYFHLETTDSLLPKSPEDTLAIAVFLPIALLANALVGQARLRAAEAEQRRHEASVAAARVSELAEQEAALHRVAKLVARGVPPPEVFTAVAAEVANALRVYNAGLFRYEADGSAVLVAAHDEAGLRKMPVGTRVTLEGDNVAAMVLRTGRTARMDSHEDAAGSAAAVIRDLGLRSGIGAPIVVDGRLWGAAIVGSSRPKPPPPDTEARLADFAELVATAIANADARAELTASRARIITAADDARRRIERDLHDGAQQRLVSLGLTIRSVEASIPSDLVALKKQISDIGGALVAASEELRELSRGIHPAVLSRGGLPPAVRALARRCPVPVKLEVKVDRRLPESVEVAVYYVVAEALTNAAKHAGAATLTVAMEAGPDRISLSIRDDGIGGADTSKGSGLVGLKDRVEALGGHMVITSRAGGGTTLNAEIPTQLD